MADGTATVLVVDDEPAVTDMYAAWLDGYDVETANGGTEALELASEDVDAVLLDRQMPGMSGDETLRRLRDRGVRCPVAVVTAVEPDVDVIALGFDEYVCKPVRDDELRRVVADLRVRARYADEIREYFALASKRATLRAAHDETELAASESYRRLTAELDRAAERARAARDDLFGGDGFEATLRHLLRRDGG